MKHVLYLRMHGSCGITSPLMNRRSFDALFTDADGTDAGFQSCLTSLGSDDTLYIEHESDIAGSLVEAVGRLAELARRGVNVWVERKKALIESATSPFLGMDGSLAQAVVDFRNAFTRFRARKGIARMKAEGRILGRRAVQLPENFEAVREQWLSHTISVTQAAAMCEMKPSTFYAYATRDTDSTQQA